MRSILQSLKFGEAFDLSFLDVESSTGLRPGICIIHRLNLLPFEVRQISKCESWVDNASAQETTGTLAIDSPRYGASQERRASTVEKDEELHRLLLQFVKDLPLQERKGLRGRRSRAVNKTQLARQFLDHRDRTGLRATGNEIGSESALRRFIRSNPTTEDTLGNLVWLDK